MNYDIIVFTSHNPHTCSSFHVHMHSDIKGYDADSVTERKFPTWKLAIETFTAEFMLFVGTRFIIFK